MNRELKKKLDELLCLAVEVHTGQCTCVSVSGENGCESCGWTGVQIPHPNSSVIGYEVLFGCVFAMAEARAAGDSETVNDILTWARKYVAPSIEGVDLEAASKEGQRRAAKGRALVEEAKQGPTESLSVEELKRRLGGHTE